MARYTNFLGSAKVIAATTAQTLVWTGNDLPGSGLVALHFAFKGSGNAANTLAEVFPASGGRLRVRADGNTIVDLNFGMFSAHQERFSQANYAPLSTATAFSLWLNMSDIVDDDLADTCQFPKGAMCTVELTTAATTKLGSAVCGWTQTNVPAKFSPYLVGQQMNIPAGAINQSFPISEPGLIRGYGLPTVGLDRAKLTLQGFDWDFLPGAVYNTADVTAAPLGDMFRDSEQIENGIVITNPIWHRVNELPGSVGGSRVELTTTAATGSSWAGTANELTIWSVRPQ